MHGTTSSNLSISLTLTAGLHHPRKPSGPVSEDRFSFVNLERNKTRDQRPDSGTKIRDQILSAEYCCQTCMYRAEI